LLACNPGLELELVASWDGMEFTFSTANWREEFGERGSPPEPSLLIRLREHLRAGLADLRRAEEVAAGLQRRDN
ncbi:MAG: hypothetical protein K6U03_01155, partial [Firmicutes bacterium]|nr:hypothetical protein [Bacillota bacterium]